MTTFVPVVRSASLNGYQELAHAVGLNAHSMLRRAGLPLRSLSDPDMPLRTDAVRALLEISAEASGVGDFGLRLAGLRQFSNLGPISLVLQEESTARQALDTLCRYLQLLNPSLRTWLETSDGLLLIREDIVTEHDGQMRQSMELALGVMHRILGKLMGSTWHPLAVCFKHPAPDDVIPHRVFFGTRVDFNAGFNGIVCRASELDAVRAGGNPQMASFARQYLDRALSTGTQSTQATVRQLMVALLPGGRCTTQQVAQHLGMDRRTVHRYLKKEGTTFSDVLQLVRIELAKRQLEQTDQPLNELATLLGFASPSAFAYWFRDSFGCSARAWRNGQRQIVTDS